jgi:hypothetical protein
MSAPVLYSIIVITLIITAASVTLRRTFQRMYALNDNSFESCTTQMAFSVGYMYLIVLPCTSMVEYRKLICFIKQWGYLQVTNLKYVTGYDVHYQCFGGKYCLHLQYRRISRAYN